MEYGIWFKLKDGTTDYYDPLREEDLKITESHYILQMNYTYEILKEEVLEFGWYDLCEKCRHDVGYCRCEN